MRVLTIDLEDWFQVYNFNKIIKFKDWDNHKVRAVNKTKRLLKILNEHNTKATFFVLGWIADKHPELIKDIHDGGHEIACHGYCHKPIFLMSKKEFAKDIDKAKKAIKKSCGVNPVGYRAPSFSIVKNTLWALDTLKKKGFKYDSSMVPGNNHPDYGIKNIPKRPFKIKDILEIPMTTFFGFPLGGGYFRLYPYCLTKFLLKKRKNAIFYVHPWEFDPKMPRYKLPLIKKFRHYVGLNSTEKKFKKLLKDFRFSRIEDVYKRKKIKK